jgi:hypothetical protein
MFRQAKIDNKRCYIPNGDYYIIAPLETIGNSSVGSTEKGNFAIEGESVQHTTLLFNLTSDDQVAMPFAIQSNGWNISKFRIKSLSSGRFGTGMSIPSTYKSNINQIQIIYFNIGLKTDSYISNFINIDCANNNCGFYYVFGTSTTFMSCYAEYNKPLNGEVRTYDYILNLYHVLVIQTKSLTR